MFTRGQLVLVHICIYLNKCMVTKDVMLDKQEIVAAER